MILRRRLNVRLAIWLSASVALLGTAAHVAHGIQVKRNASAFLAQAKRARDAGRLAEAADDLFRYLVLVPEDDNALAEYSLLLADDKLTTSRRAVECAFFALEHALRRDPQRHDVRRRVIQVAMSPWLNRFHDAGQHLDRLIASVPNDGELEGLRARCYEANGDYQKARHWFEQALNHAPNDIDNYVRLTYLLRQQANKVKKGEKTT